MLTGATEVIVWREVLFVSWRLEILLQWNGSHPTCIVALLLWQFIVVVVLGVWPLQIKRTEKAVYRKVGITPSSLFSNEEVRLQLLHSFHWEQALD